MSERLGSMIKERLESAQRERLGEAVRGALGEQIALGGGFDPTRLRKPSMTESPTTCVIPSRTGFVNALPSFFESISPASVRSAVSQSATRGETGAGASTMGLH